MSTARCCAGPGLLYRYIPSESLDGLPGHEGAFLLCSFWLVDMRSKVACRRRCVFTTRSARAGPLGLLPEQIDPPTGALLGSYPQAFSHVGVISSGINLSQTLRDAVPPAAGDGRAVTRGNDRRLT